MAGSRCWLLLFVLAALGGVTARADDAPAPPKSPPPGSPPSNAETPPSSAPPTAAEVAAIDAILERLKSDDPVQVRRALEELVPWGRRAQKALPVVLLHLRDSSYRTRAAASKVLGGLGAVALPDVLKVLREGDERGAEAAGMAIGRMGPEAVSAIPELIGLLDDPRADVVFAVFDALSELGPVAVSAVPALLALSKRPNEGLSSGALGALGAIDPANPEVIARFESALRLGRCSSGMSALYGLLRAGRPGWDALVDSIEKEGFAGPRAERSEFGPLEGESSLHFLELCGTLVDDGREVLVDIGRRAITQLDDPGAESVPVAVRRLRAGSTPTDRMPWLFLLGHVGVRARGSAVLEPAVPILRELAQSTDPEEKAQAQQVLATIDAGAKRGGSPIRKAR